MNRSTLFSSLWLPVLSLLLIVAALFSGFLPLAMPFGIAAGGVLETGQVVPSRWWAGAALAIIIFGLLGWRASGRARLWWLAMLVAGLALAIGVFVTAASRGQPKAVVDHRPFKLADVAVASALPLFWSEEGALGVLDPRSARSAPRFSRHRLRPIDSVDARVLRGADALLLAQPRLLQPAELVAIDDWVRAGGKAVILADPMLVWPGALPAGDARRAPITSLLDPLLAHWGLQLDPAPSGKEVVERRMLSTGHVLMLAGASGFRIVPGGGVGAQCRLSEQGLMALCRIGQGVVRLIADADLVDERLWLADPRWPDRDEARASDIGPLLDGWLMAPLDPPSSPPPSRVTDEAALTGAVRIAMIVALLWVLAGWSIGRLIRWRRSIKKG